jgi:predicted RNase H-like nuclease
MGLVAGVDACRGGWVAVLIERGSIADSVFDPSCRELLDGLRSASHIAIDIPIGLPAEGVRAADIEARAFVGPRRSSVFSAPPRPTILAVTYAEARLTTPSLSAQSFALAKKILEVEKCLDDRLFEVHPEVSFAALAGHPLRYSKKSWNGHMERRLLLEEQGLEPPARVTGNAAPDDVLDATVAAWSAERKARGQARTLPVDPPLQDGRPVAIWY